MTPLYASEDPEEPKLGYSPLIAKVCQHLSKSRVPAGDTPVSMPPWILKAPILGSKPLAAKGCLQTCQPKDPEGEWDHIFQVLKGKKKKKANQEYYTQQNYPEMKR